MQTLISNRANQTIMVALLDLANDLAPAEGVASASWPTVEYSTEGGTIHRQALSLSDRSPTDAHTPGAVVDLGAGRYSLDLPDEVATAVRRGYVSVVGRNADYEVAVLGGGAYVSPEVATAENQPAVDNQGMVIANLFAVQGDSQAASRLGNMTENYALRSEQPLLDTEKRVVVGLFADGLAQEIGRAVEAALVDDSDPTASLQAIANSVADNLASSDLTEASLAAAVVDAWLSRSVEGQSYAAGTGGALLQVLAMLRGKLPEAAYLTGTGNQDGSVKARLDMNQDTPGGSTTGDQLDAAGTGGGGVDEQVDGVPSDTYRAIMLAFAEGRRSVEQIDSTTGGSRSSDKTAPPSTPRPSTPPAKSPKARSSNPHRAQHGQDARSNRIEPETAPSPRGLRPRQRLRRAGGRDPPGRGDGPRLAQAAPRRPRRDQRRSAGRG